MTRLAALAAALALATALGGCGLQPLYSGGTASPVAQGLASVAVPPIEGRAGWLLRNALNDRLQPMGQGDKRYRLDVRLDDSLEGLGVLNDDAISRERRMLRARYQLVDTSTGEILLDATAGSDAGIDVVSSEYATIAAEQRALENLARDLADRIVVALSQQFTRGK